MKGLYGPVGKDGDPRVTADVIAEHDSFTGPLCPRLGCGCTEVEAEVGSLTVEAQNLYSPGGMDYDELGIFCARCGTELPEGMTHYTRAVGWPRRVLQTWAQDAYEEAVNRLLEEPEPDWDER